MKPIVPTSTPPSLPVAPVLKPPLSLQPSRRSLSLPMDALLGKIHVMAEAGAGKSRWLGRCLGWQLLRYGVPSVIIDPTGGTADNLIDKIIRSPPELQECLWKRLIYVDLSGKGGYVPAFPVYYRLSKDDSLYDIAQRYVEVVERLDPYLKTASVMGLNAIINLGTYTGMLLAALGYQITEAEDLIRHSDRWERRLERALSLTPEVKPAVDFFRAWKPDARIRQSESFLTKIQAFTADPKTRAIFGASEPGVSWDQVVKQGQTVLLDLRNVPSAKRRFLFLWVFRSGVDYLKHRGVAGRRRPVAFIIDEITQLLGFGQEQSVMAEDIEELISVVARNYGVYLVVAHQNLPQINSERIQKALMTMGTQMIGVQTDPESAQYLANYFFRYDPYEEKRNERVWMQIFNDPVVIDYRPVEFTPEEQALMNSGKFMDLGKFEFLVRAPRREGDLRAPLRKVSIGNLDRGLYPIEEVVAKARELLMKRDGRPIREVLGEIEARQSGLLNPASPTHSENIADEVAVDSDPPGFWGE